MSSRWVCNRLVCNHLVCNRLVCSRLVCSHLVCNRLLCSRSRGGGRKEGGRKEGRRTGYENEDPPSRLWWEKMKISMKKMTFPKSIRDQSGMVPGSLGHQKTSI